LHVAIVVFVSVPLAGFCDALTCISLDILHLAIIVLVLFMVALCNRADHYIFAL